MFARNVWGMAILLLCFACGNNLATDVCSCECCNNLTGECTRSWNATFTVSDCSVCKKTFCIEKCQNSGYSVDTNMDIEAKCTDRDSLWNKVVINALLALLGGLIVLGFIKNHSQRVRVILRLEDPPAPDPQPSYSDGRGASSSVASSAPTMRRSFFRAAGDQQNGSHQYSAMPNNVSQ